MSLKNKMVKQYKFVRPVDNKTYLKWLDHLVCIYVILFDKITLSDEFFLLLIFFVKTLPAVSVRKVVYHPWSACDIVVKSERNRCSKF